MYWAAALWLSYFFDVVSLFSFPILTSYRTTNPLSSLVMRIPLKDVGIVDSICRVFDLNHFAALDSSRRKSCVPFAKLSLTWSMKISSKVPSWACRNRSHGSVVERCIPRRSGWFRKYVRYQWSPLYGMSYNGFTTCNTTSSGRPISFGGLMYTGLSNSLALCR